MTAADVAKAERDILKDEISGVTAQLIAVHGMTERGVRSIARRVLKSGKPRKVAPVSRMRIATKEDLLADLEEVVVELGVSRQVQFAVSRGIKLVRKEREDAR